MFFVRFFSACVIAVSRDYSLLLLLRLLVLMLPASGTARAARASAISRCFCYRLCVAASAAAGSTASLGDDDYVSMLGLLHLPLLLLILLLLQLGPQDLFLQSTLSILLMLPSIFSELMNGLQWRRLCFTGLRHGKSPPTFVATGNIDT